MRHPSCGLPKGVEGGIGFSVCRVDDFREDSIAPYPTPEVFPSVACVPPSASMGSETWERHLCIAIQDIARLRGVQPVWRRRVCCTGGADIGATPRAMKAVRIHRHGSAEVLQVDEIPVPVPAYGQLLVEIHAASDNPGDLKVREGTVKYMRPALPHTLGRDFSGVVYCLIAYS